MNGFSVQIQNLPRPDSYLVKTVGSVDMKTAQELESACEALLSKGQERLLFEFSGLDYINSQGLGVLLSLQKQLSAKGGGVVVVGMTERVKKVFITTGVRSLIRTYEDTQEALTTDKLFRED
jgi:anti-sigma B factor antagonist